MTKYKNLSGKSGVNLYSTTEESITVKFKDLAQYIYTYQSAGTVHIEEMKRLAAAGAGLNTYINKNVRKLYQERLR